MNMWENRAAMTRKKKNLIISLTVLQTMLISPVAFFAVAIMMSEMRSIRPTSYVRSRSQRSGLVHAVGNSLYDANDNRLVLKGVNAGNLLIYEGWISPFSVGEKRDKTGNLILDADGLTTYPDMPMEEALKGFQSNSNLTDKQREALVNIYRENWFSEVDFKNIYEMGMNTIRLPFYWKEILDEKDGVFVRKDEKTAFSYIDSFVSNCQKYNLYCVLDLHGAPGSQNGYEHSGDMSRADLWSDETYQNATVDIWKFIAEHYTYTNPKLGKSIAAYDLLNEPCAYYNDQGLGSVPKVCGPVFDKIYQGIRSVGDKHVINIEGIWSYDCFPNPDEYGWENIQYDIHLYNREHESVPYWYFNLKHEMNLWGNEYDVPYSVSEFNFFDDEDAWKSELKRYDRRGYSWMMWTYKAAVRGWWDTTWSLYTEPLKLWDNKVKVNLATSNYEELKKAFEATNTSNCIRSKAYDYVYSHLHQG